MTRKQPKRKKRPGIDEYGRTPLHYAAAEGRVDNVIRLLGAGANPNLQDDNGWSPLHFAAQTVSPGATEALLAAGADTKLRDFFGNTALSTAVFASKGDGSVIELLLRAGADPHAANSSGVTPLGLARTIGNYNMAQFFSDLPGGGKEMQWYTGEVQREGFPLLLRFPAKPDFDTLSRRYPKLFVVEHTLAKVMPSGLPEPAYNHSLADFDHDLVSAFERLVSGITVLVETFGGRRNYYIYVSADAPVEDVKRRLCTKYPQHQLDWSLQDDAGWKFIRRYSKEYKFYKKR
jgi:uncharacterized protein